MAFTGPVNRLSIVIFGARRMKKKRHEQLDRDEFAMELPSARGPWPKSFTCPLTSPVTANARFWGNVGLKTIRRTVFPT